jgi:hypothetical protein
VAGSRRVGFAVVGNNSKQADPVVVIEQGQLAQIQATASEQASEATPSITALGDGAMINQRESFGVKPGGQQPLGHGHPDRVGHSLAQRTGGDLHAGQQPPRGMPGAVRPQLAKRPDIRQRDVVAGQMQRPAGVQPVNHRGDVQQGARVPLIPTIWPSVDGRGRGDEQRTWDRTGSLYRVTIVLHSAMAAVAATAALLATLNRRGLSPERSQVVIAGAATMPVLRPLLLAAGFGCVTSWDRRDATTFPLRGITRNATAVIDLLGCTRELAEATSDHPELITITPDKTSWAVLALPDLLPAVMTTQDPKIGVEDYHTCALALAATTPPERLLPNPIQPALASPVEQAGARVPAPLGPALSTPTFRFPPPPPRAQTSASCRLRCMVNRKYSKTASATA